MDNMQLRSKLVPPAIVSDDISNRENHSRKRTRSDQSIHNTNVTQNSTKTYCKLRSMSTSANKTTIENRATERLKKSKKEPNNISENIKNDENVSHTDTEPDTVLVPISNYRKQDKKKEHSGWSNLKKHRFIMRMITKIEAKKNC